MSQNLPTFGVVVFRNVVHLVKQRQIVVRNHIASDTRVAVPIPGATYVGAPFDDSNALHTTFSQSCRRKQGRKTTANEQHLDRVANRFARGDLTRIWIHRILRQGTGELGGVLGSSFRPIFQSEIALFSKLLFDLVVVCLRVFHGIPLIFVLFK